MLSDHMRRRAADGDGGAARPLRRARIFVYCAWSLDQYLSDGAVSRRLSPGDHIRARAADGQGGGGFRRRSDRDSPPQPHQDLSPYVGHRSHLRRSELCRDHGGGGRRHRRAGVPRPSGESARRRSLSRSRPGDVFRAHRLRHAGVRGARHGGDAGLGNRRDDHGPVGLRRGAHRRISARTGPAHHAVADHCRRARHVAGAYQDRARRHRPHAYGWGTFASRSLVIAGGATLLAARKIRAKLTKMAGTLLEASADDIVLEADAARAAYHQTHQFKGEVAPGIIESATYDPPGTFSNACHVAVVEVDVETGRVMIEKFLVAEDAGRLINPMIVDGQIHGGVAQGIANALLEEIVYDETGNILTASLADYLPPTAREIPPIEIHHFETLTPASITKAKGLGEGGAIGAPAAVVNAVNDALSPFGASIDEFPATPQRIRAALRAAGALSKHGS